MTDDLTPGGSPYVWITHDEPCRPLDDEQLRKLADSIHLELPPVFLCSPRYMPPPRRWWQFWRWFR